MADSSLQLPRCDHNTLLETEVHLYINDDVLAEYSKEFVQAKINAWMAFANMTLENSCIPISRKVTHIEYVPAIDSSWFKDVDVSERFLKLSFERDFPEHNNDGVPIFKGIVFANSNDSFQSNNCGYASGSSLFFNIALNCPDDVMEHEIGHLSGASHDIKTLKEQMVNFDINEYLISSYPKSEKFAFGAVCSGRGTIMSYERDIIPVYSNPDTTFNGETCGSEDLKNNAKVLREFAKKYLHKSKNNNKDKI